MKIRKRTQARECAIQILYQHEMNPDGGKEAIEHYWAQAPAHPPEVRQFASNLVSGTIQHLKEIDEVIMRYTENWELKRMAVVDRNILRLATYELLFMEDIPPKVAINEAVNIAKKFSQEESGKFVNGILDKISHWETKRCSASNTPPATPL